ncbi:ABC transporter permease [Streptomyces sp. BI20]|uniref:ABC transporter permease n=1 Tax=Streptomyces sp. BI20 TaxID=3403460 RepID=UPI003C753C07
MFRTALRNVLAHKARLLMTLLAVTLGVAFVSGTLTYTDTISKAKAGRYEEAYRALAVVVTHDGPEAMYTGKKAAPGIDRKTVDAIAALPGVDRVAPRVFGFAAVGDRDGKLIGENDHRGSNFAPGPDGKDPAHTFTAGAAPTGPGQVALDKDTAAQGAYKPGDTVRVAGNGPVTEATVSGVFTTTDPKVHDGGSLILFDTATAQQRHLEPGFHAEVSVTAKAGTDPRKLLAAIKPLLDKDTKAETGSVLAGKHVAAAEKEMANLNQMLLAFAGIALFVGVFLIHNTFTMLVTQRTRELALLRAVGATRGQVKRAVLAEAGVVGVIGSAIGLVSGIGLAAGLDSAMAAVGVKIPRGELVVAPSTVIAAVVIGLIVTLIAAWLPARQTAKIPPVAALGSAHLPATAKSLVLRTALGGSLALLGLGVCGAGVAVGEDNGRFVIAAGAFFLLIGLIVALPALARPLLAVVRRPLERLFGTAGKLSALNAARNPRRTSATAASLAVGLTMVSTLSILGVALGTAIGKMSTDNVKADYRVTMAGRLNALDPSVLTALAKAPGITTVSPKSSGSFRIGDKGQVTETVDPDTIGDVTTVDMVHGDLKDFGGDKVLVTEAAAASNDLTVGSTFEATFAGDAKATLTVAGIHRDPRPYVHFMLDLRTYAAHSGDTGVSEILVKTEGGASKAAEKSILDALGNSPAMKVATKEQMRAEMAGSLDTMLNVMYGLMGMALVISVLGIVNTLAMSVYERTQEIGMLRAIGLDRPRVRNMIRLEAVVISLFGAVLGTGIGAFLAWAVGTTFADGMYGHYAYLFPVGRLALFLLGAAAVGVLAAAWPARNAAELDMLTAIKTE